VVEVISPRVSQLFAAPLAVIAAFVSLLGDESSATRPSDPSPEGDVVSP
jgi:hypothetical protein